MTKTRDLADLANGITSANIVDGAITNADINSSAAVVSSKLAFTQSGTGAQQRTVESKLRDVVSVSDYGTVQQAIDATPAGNTLFINTNPCSFDGVTINKALRIVGLGREQGVVTGSITVTNAGYFACFEDISFESPSGSALFTITGRGGLDFKRCRLLPGSGNYAFNWDATQSGTTYTPVALELIQTYFQSGKMLYVGGTATKFFPIHAKEGCQTRFTETAPFDIINTNATAEFLQYEGQLDINSGLASLGDIARLSFVLRNTSIDDGSNLCLTSNLVKTDIVDCSIKVNNISRQSTAPSVYKGSGLTSTESMVRAAATSGTVTLRPDLHGQDLFFITGNVTLTGNTTYAIGGAPLYDGQKVEVVFTGTTTRSTFNFNIFGLITVVNVPTIEPFVVTLYGYGGTWYPRLSGVRSAMTLQAVGTQPANADTSGATLTQLENEVNEIKAALRNTAIIAT